MVFFMVTVALDAGHGGSDYGATNLGRLEKNDTLRLTQAVGSILEKNPAISVFYTRTNDTYESPSKKARDANEAGADYFISIHRNATPVPNTYSGVETLVYNNYGRSGQLAKNISKELADIGFANLGINERKNLVVLRDTDMPAVLLEVGYINTVRDNSFFDENFDAIAQAIADGIEKTVL